jgi:hypothetical protein
VDARGFELRSQAAPVSEQVLTGQDELEGADIDCVEQGYLEYGLAMMRLFEAGDIAGARTGFVQAGKIGARFAHRELVTLARIGEGRMVIYLGEFAEGMALLDEAMASIEARELSPIATGDAYCTIIDACAALRPGPVSSVDRVVRTLVRHQQELVLTAATASCTARDAGTAGAWPERSTKRDRVRPSRRTRQPCPARRRLHDRG